MIELKGITWDHPRGYQPLAASTEKYAAEQGVRVTWEARSLKDFGDAPIDVLADQYDVLVIDHPHTGFAHKRNCLLPLETVINADTLAQLAAESAGPSHASYFYAGHQWALANDAAMQAAAYRPDLMNEPFPNDWESVIRLAEKLRPKGLYIGIPLVPTDCICCFVSLTSSLGEPITEDSTAFVSKAVAGQALDWLLRCADISHPGSLGWNPILMLNHMGSRDDVAYCPMTFTYTNYARQGYADKIIRYTNIPGIKGSILGGAGFAISAKCPHPEVAAAYGVWLSSAETQRTFYVEEGGQPGNIVAWQDPNANTLTNNFFLDTLDTLVNAHVRPRYDGWATFQEEAGYIIHAFLVNRTSIDQCYEELAAQYEASLA